MAILNLGVLAHLLNFRQDGPLQQETTLLLMQQLLRAEQSAFLQTPHL
jgi:hypothetical protein